MFLDIVALKSSFYCEQVIYTSLPIMAAVDAMGFK